MIWSIDRAATLDRSISFMLLVVFSWLIYQFTDTPSRQQWLMRAYIFGTAIVLAAMFLGVVHFAESSGEGAHRFTAKGANPNGLAFAYITSINFALYLVTRPGQKVKGFMKAAYWVFIVLAGCGVFYTGSRSGALGLGICGFFSLVTMFRVVGWKPAAILVICIAVIGFLVVELVPGFLLSRVGEGQSAASFQDRLAAWQGGLAKWSERPLQGYGSATNGGHEMMLAHNTLVTVLVDTGLVGFGLYTAFWLLLLSALLSLPKTEMTFWLVVFASFAPSFLSGSAEHDKVLWLLCAMVLAQAAALRSRAVPSAPRTTARLRPT